MIYPLFIFNLKNLRRRRRGTESLRFFDGLKGDLRSLRSMIENVEDVINGKKAYSLRLHCYEEH